MNDDASRPAKTAYWEYCTQIRSHSEPVAVACCRCQHAFNTFCRSLQHLELLPPPQVAEHSVQSLQSCGVLQYSAGNPHVLGCFGVPWKLIEKIDKVTTCHHGSTKIKGLEDPWCSSRPNIPPQGSHCDHAINTGIAAIHNLHETGLRHCETAITSTLHTSLCKT